MLIIDITLPDTLFLNVATGSLDRDSELVSVRVQRRRAETGDVWVSLLSN